MRNTIGTESPITGHKNGPSVDIACLVDFDPWLVLRLTAVPGTILVGGTSTLTADLTFNSDSVDTHLSGNIPDLTPVGFMGNAFGTVAPPTTSTTLGKANSIYTGMAPGTGNVSTTVDMQTVTTPITVNPSPCVITCPANVTQPNDPNQCGAVATYNAPTPVRTCGTVVCSPATGSFFPVGTTTVTCKSNNNAGPELCNFTVTINDTQAPVITCSGDINATAAASCPIATAVTANFMVTASDNCPGVITVCNPPSGVPFPIGTTTVICTATDAAGNTATCSFTVSAFSFCLQDNSDPGNVVFVNAVTGDFSFCCGGVPIASGRGTLTTRGCIGSIDHTKGNRQVHIQWDTAAVNGLGAGTAFVRKLSDKIVCQITDRNMSNNTCQCSNPPPTGSPRKPPTERTF
jgi:HYR domain